MRLRWITDKDLLWSLKSGGEFEISDLDVGVHGEDDYFCGSDDLCRTYPEVLSCVVAGAPACRMAFFNATERKYILVLTNSDQASAMMVIARMDATGYDVADIKQRQ